MKKLLSFALVLAMVFAITIPAMATGNLYKDADDWYYSSEEAGTLIVMDNHTYYSYNNIVAGTNFLDSQSKFSGRLNFISFEPIHTCNFVKTLDGADVTCQITKDNGNQNSYSFVMKEEFKWECSCGKTQENTFKYTTYVSSLANNYKGNVSVGNYTVYISSSGNIKIDALYIVE